MQPSRGAPMYEPRHRAGTAMLGSHSRWRASAEGLPRWSERWSFGRSSTQGTAGTTRSARRALSQRARGCGACARSGWRLMAGDRWTACHLALSRVTMSWVPDWSERGRRSTGRRAQGWCSRCRRGGARLAQAVV
eukprot:7286732-Prymnesium_polylepis.1